MQAAAAPYSSGIQMRKWGGVASLAVLLAGCGTASDLWNSLPDAQPSEEVLASTVDIDGREVQRGELLTELKALREELEKRSTRLRADLTDAKAELARRQAAGEISDEQVQLSPTQIREAQVSELEKLKAELARRQQAKDVKQQRIARALSENESAYTQIDMCLSNASDFRRSFEGRNDLQKIVDERENKVYRSPDRTLLLLTSQDTCDVSFAGTDLPTYTEGLQHILETQGGVVEKREVANITVISVAHPKGNFRLTSGRKVLGGGGLTNLYTTISVVKG